MQKYDVESIIIRLSGLEGTQASRRQRIERVCAKIFAAGLYPISRNGVEKWFERGTVPTRWQHDLAKVARRERIPFDMNEFRLEA